jgi:hypothetical protein
LTVVIIQCASAKHGSKHWQEKHFVAHPVCDNQVRPDDSTTNLKTETWRDVVLRQNSPGLMMAYRLYKPKIYQQLASAVGTENLYLLSAGWGLVNSAFMLPPYDITFSAGAQKLNKRLKTDRYKDFKQLRTRQTEILFFGTPSYYDLLQDCVGPDKRLTVYKRNSTPSPPRDHFICKEYRTTIATNWHYQCARDWLTSR